MDDPWTLLGWFSGAIALGVAVSVLTAWFEQWLERRRMERWVAKRRHPLTRYPKRGLDDD